MENIKNTLLHKWHVANGAKMADFGGYEMPLWYASAKDEHLSVITNAGIFDTSHMAVVMVSGKDAYNLLQHCFTNDLNRCIGKDKKPIYAGRCVYGAFLNENGYVIDDTIIYKIGEADFLAVVNAGMGGKIAQHLMKNQGEKTVVITDMTDKLGKMDIQGPASAKILGKILANPAAIFDKMPYFSFKGHFDSALNSSVILKDKTPVMISRTGYTGEFGFEIFMEPQHLVKVWEMIFKAGQDFNLRACGLAARDSLRGGAVLPLSHQDIGNWLFINHPWHFALPFTDDQHSFTKTFIGDTALLNVQNPEYTYPFVGYDLRKIVVCNQGGVIDSQGNNIGKVLTCVSDMAIGRQNNKIYSIASPDKPLDFELKGLCCGFIKVNKKLKPGDIVEITDQRRKIKVEVTQDIRPHRTARRRIEEMV